MEMKSLSFRPLQGDDVELSAEEKKRYNRHILLPEIGEAGQERLKLSRVLIVGTGGLGSPVALYLGAAGVGTIGLIDDDRVDESNLQRQIIHSTETLGVPKVESAARRLKALNPFLKIEEFKERFTGENGDLIVKGYDLIVDGTDNLNSRHLINRISRKANIPYVYGAVFRFEGQVSLFNQSVDSPCYRCLYREPEEEEGEAPRHPPGIMGVLPGVIGSIQATEAIKVLLKIGKSLNRRLLVYDAMEMKFREFSIEKNPACPICGKETH